MTALAIFGARDFAAISTEAVTLRRGSGRAAFAGRIGWPGRFRAVFLSQCQRGAEGERESGDESWSGFHKGERLLQGDGTEIDILARHFDFHARAGAGIRPGVPLQIRVADRAHEPVIRLHDLGGILGRD